MHGNIPSLVDSTGVPLNKSGILGIVSAGGGSVSEFINATGGDSVADDGNYRVRTFLSSGTFEITSNTGGYTYDVLIIAGGGSGGNDNGGYGSAGGGAGGFVKLTGQAGTVQTYAITIGAGGAAPTTAGQNGNKGSNTIFGSVQTCIGGGYGGGRQLAGGSGGSGGGSSYGVGAGGSGTVGQGNNGGNGTGTYGSGGGGGSGAVGSNGGTNIGGNAGAGTSDSITGSSVCYSGGGGGKGQISQGTATCGGTAGNSLTAGTDGLGGGSGGGGNGGSYSAGKGGNGVVIVRYQFQ